MITEPFAFPTLIKTTQSTLISFSKQALILLVAAISFGTLAYAEDPEVQAGEAEEDVENAEEPKSVMGLILSLPDRMYVIGETTGGNDNSRSSYRNLR